MPIYEYRCESCGHLMEALRRLGQGPDGLQCPACGSDRLVQQLSVFAASTGSSRPAGCPAPGGNCGGSSGGG